jgi:hypothetical protein
MKRCFLLMSSILFFPVSGISQSADRQIQDRVSGTIDFNTLMFSADYASNTNVMGIFSLETKQPSISPSLAYFSKWGADFTVMGYFVDNSDDSLENFTSELDLMLGYTLHPTEYLSIYPSYAHYFYSSNSNSLKSMFTDEFRLDVDYNKKVLNIGASAGYYLGKHNAFYAALHNYYRIDVNNFLFRNATLCIQPGFDLNFGSYEYLNQYYLDELREDPYFYAYLLSFPTVRRYVYIEMRQNPDLSYQEILDQYLEEQAEDSFKLTSISINLPVYFFIGNFGINLGLYAMIPFSQPDYMTDDVQFFFNVGLTYNLLFK